MPRIATIIFAAAIVVSLSGVSIAQHEVASEGGPRKVTTRIEPAYPELAKRMRLEGSVKLAAVVRANGSVKSTRVIGGNPVLVQAASDAVSRWAFEVGPNETTEIVQFTFVPR